MHELLENHWNLINDKAKWSLFRHSLWNVRQFKAGGDQNFAEYINYAWKQINLQHDNELR